MLRPLSREARITLGSSFYGIYTLGMASTESEMIDEDCVMDNIGVPFYEELLKPEHIKCLEEHAFYRNFVGPPFPSESDGVIIAILLNRI